MKIKTILPIFLISSYAFPQKKFEVVEKKETPREIRINIPKVVAIGATTIGAWITLTNYAGL